MERLAEIIAILDDAEQVAAQSSEELAALQTELLAIAEQTLAGELTPAEGTTVVDVLAQIADYAAPADGGIAYVLAVRTAEAEAQAAAIEEQRTRLGLVAEEAAPEAEVAPVEAPAPAPAPEAAAPEAAPVVEAEPAPALAAAPAPAPALPSTAEMAASSPAPRVQVGADRLMEAVETGESIDLDGLVKLAIEKFDRFQGMSSDSIERVPLARIRLNYDDDARLDNARANDSQVNAKLSALVDNAWDPARWQDEALVASGGFCAPAQPDYDIPQVSGTQRPVRDSLPRMGMDRGSVTVVQPPRLVDVATSTAQTASSAISVWTNTIDTTPGGTTKPVQTIACPSPQTIALQAIVEQLQIGNFEARAFPELIRTVMANTAAAWARRAEGQLIAQIDAASTAITTPQVLGATGDFLGNLSRLAASVRNRNRMPADAKLRVMLPRWFVDFIASDIAHQHAGDGILDRYTIGEAEVRQMLASRNVNVTFYEDQSDRAGAVAQIFGVQGATQLRHWPPGLAVANPNVVWFLFPEGTHTVGDGGTLELGIVRDSTLNNTNDYRFFTESWEVIVPKVIESWKVTSTLCDSGAGQIDASGSYCGAS